MAGFRFRLQSLLNIKEQMEKSIKNQLGIAIQKYQYELTVLSQIQNSLESQENQYRADGAAKTTALKLKQRLEYIGALREKERSQKDKVNKEKGNVDKIRERLIEIMKEKRVLEKLKEKEFVEYRKEQEKKQQVIIDEIVSFKEAVKF